MTDKRYAQDMAFWSTTVSLSKSKGDIEGLLEKFGAQAYGTWIETRGERPVLFVKFIYRNIPFQMEYSPFDVKTYHAQKSENELKEQAVRQMGRIAVNHVKIILQLAIEGGHQEVLIPYAALAGSKDGQAQTLQRLGVEGIVKLLEDASEGRLALPAAKEDL